MELKFANKGMNPKVMVTNNEPHICYTLAQGTLEEPIGTLERLIVINEDTTRMDEDKRDVSPRKKEEERAYSLQGDCRPFNSENPYSAISMWQ